MAQKKTATIYDDILKEFENTLLDLEKEAQDVIKEVVEKEKLDKLEELKKEI